MVSIWQLFLSDVDERQFNRVICIYINIIFLRDIRIVVKQTTYLSTCARKLSTLDANMRVSVCVCVCVCVYMGELSFFVNPWGKVVCMHVIKCDHKQR